ncbi:MAG: phage baseplate assembly protein [Roseomonas mucosa]|nr:phage baseplate assembly protein [Roseomonas mucosa]
MDDETAMALRGVAVRGMVSGFDDTGAMQTVDGETHEGVARGTIEVHQPFGFASLPPDGAFTIFFALGGDQGDMVALPPMHPDYRFGGLEPGESVLYDDEGNRVHIRRGGIIEIVSARKVRILTQGVEIEAPLGVKITGPLEVDGPITSTEDISDRLGSMQQMRNVYNGHTNPQDGPPPQKME